MRADFSGRWSTSPKHLLKSDFQAHSLDLDLDANHIDLLPRRSSQFQKEKEKSSVLYLLSVDFTKKSDYRFRLQFGTAAPNWGLIFLPRGWRNAHPSNFMKKTSCTAGGGVCTAHLGIATHAAAWHFITRVYSLLQPFLDKNQPAVSVNGACGQRSQTAREGEGTGALWLAAYKTWPCLHLICNSELNIWWYSAFYFLRPVSFI